MSRKTQIRRELIEDLRKWTRFGIKKRDAKIAAKAEYRQSCGDKRAYLSPKGCFSYTSMKTYISDLKTFANWAAANTNAKDARSARQYVHNYLKWHQQKGSSPWTIKKYAHAFTRAYGCEIEDFGIEYAP